MRFIHAADIHIDSPLRGLSRHDGAPAERIRLATRVAFENLVQTAIDEQVAFVVLAGDLFDGQWPDMQTGLWTARQFRRLRDAAINVYLLRGNHDAASVIEHHLTWPENVVLFPDDAPGTFLRDDLRVALHGQGFAEREARADLASQFPEPLPGYFNIGVLHTSLQGTPDHDVYAPTHEEVLIAKRYDYWALGHVHQRQVVHEHPYIVYPGNTQGRHVREPGAKGCYLVQVEDGHVQQLRFIPTDTLRWQRCDIVLDDTADIPGVLEHVRGALARCRAESEERYLAVRLVLSGACPAHDELLDPGKRGEVEQRIRYEASQWDEELWVEKVVLRTEPLVDLAALRQSHGPMGDLLREVSRWIESEQVPDEIVDLFEPLERKGATELHEAGIRLRDLESVRGWLREAERMLATLESGR